MIATPLVAIVRQNLYFGYVGCTGYGEKTAMFPDGVPTGCSQDSQEFQITFQATKALTVAIVAGMALLGTKTMGAQLRRRMMSKQRFLPIRGHRPPKRSLAIAPERPRVCFRISYDLPRSLPPRRNVQASRSR